MCVPICEKFGFAPSLAVIAGSPPTGDWEKADVIREAMRRLGLTVEAAGKDADGKDVAFLYNWDGSGSDGDDLYFNVSYNGETYTFTVESE